MVDLTRRKTVIGLGLLATGSGATFTSAAFSSSTAPTADLRVVVDQALRAEKGPGFDKNEPEFVNESAFFDGEDIDDSTDAAFDGSSTPLAYVNEDVNDNLIINAAQDIGKPAFTFSEIIQISNSTTESVDVGIAYDRNASPSQYGDDVPTGSLDHNFAQRVYKFQANKLKNGDLDSNYAAGTGPTISPDPASSSPNQVRGDNDSISNDEDLPAAAVTIPEGDTLTIDLVVDTSAEETIENAVSQQTTFGSSRTTVDIMDAITVGKFDSPSKI